MIIVNFSFFYCNELIIKKTKCFEEKYPIKDFPGRAEVDR